MIISSVSEYVSEISSIATKIVSNDIWKEHAVLFRGQDDSSYDLLPSIGRNRKFSCDISILNEERNLIEMSKYRLPDVFKSDLSPIELLALLQHYGIPTRLLDVTENALVALYFACCKSFNKNGEVIIFDNKGGDVNNYPIVNAIAESYKYCMGTFTYLNTFYDNVVGQSYFDEQRYSCEFLHQNSKSKCEWVFECCKNPIFIYAPIRSARQRNQSGRYILFPNKMEIQEIDKETFYSFSKVIEPIPKNHQCISKIITIPKESKKMILKELRLFGISEESMFVDSIDVICRSIKETFEARVRFKD